MHLGRVIVNQLSTVHWSKLGVRKQITHLMTMIEKSGGGGHHLAIQCIWLVQVIDYLILYGDGHAQDC